MLIFAIVAIMCINASLVEIFKIGIIVLVFAILAFYMSIVMEWLCIGCKH